MVGRARHIEKYVLIKSVVPKLSLRDQRWKGLVLERGGGFAQVIGALELLTPNERKRVGGVIINEVPRRKLRGIRRRRVSSAEMPRHLRMRGVHRGTDRHSGLGGRSCAILLWIRKTA